MCGCHRESLQVIYYWELKHWQIVLLLQLQIKLNSDFFQSQKDSSRTKRTETNKQTNKPFISKKQI